MSTWISAAALAVGFAVTLGIALVHYQNKELRAAILWGLGAWIFAGIGLAALGLNLFVKDGASETDKGNLRPWVTVKTAQIQEGTLGVGLRPTIVVEMHNTGHSPAMDLAAFGAVKIDNDLPPWETFPLAAFKEALGASPSRTVLAPGAPLSLPVMFDDAFTVADAAGVAAGTGRMLYVVGFAEYRDQIGQQYTTTFCYMTYRGYKALAPCRKFNSAT